MVVMTEIRPADTSGAALAGGNETSSSLLSADEMLLWRGFLSWSQTVLSDVARELLHQTGLTAAEFQILVRLYESPSGALEQRTLATDLDWSASRLSHQLSRMQSRGQLIRHTEGAGHVVDVTLTDHGRTLVTSALHVHAEAVQNSFLSTLTPAHRQALLALTSP
ncbi:transcriptional regulator [Subtercola lobariae]|uniref:Transcriptional regulator n=2 Tax=Subtercola lobariae TaxID=1588641 RepID=A0A917EYG8_9MICO|nr:transcriptional regulator [Subtercola lobariae]